MGGTESKDVRRIPQTNTANNNLCVKCRKDDDSNFRFPSCKHSVCRECLCEYLDHFETAKIRCPGQGCSDLVPDSIVRKCLSNVNIERYDILSYPSFFKCLIKDCNYYVAAERKEGYFVCEFCEQRNCVTCGNLHLENEACEPSPNKVLYEKKGSINIVQKRRKDLQRLREENEILVNPEKSECLGCSEFLLPREGTLISACYHNFCRDCLEGHLQSLNNCYGFKCLKCDAELNWAECRKFANTNMLADLCLEGAKYKLFNCQSPNCSYMIDSNKNAKSFKCPECRKVNCLVCKVIHENQTCDEFRKTPRYEECKQFENENMKNPINCYNCNKLIIKNGGCNALKCDHCGKQVCAFSGKEIGPKGCGCKKSRKCDHRCTKGCIPEEKSDYGDMLRKYYYER